MKWKQTVSIFGELPFDRIPKVTNDVNVHLYIHIVTFSDEFIMDNAL